MPPDHGSSRARLRLVGHEGAHTPEQVSMVTGETTTDLRALRAEVGRENIAAAALSREQAEQFFARCADLAIEGGRAAVLRPRVRRRLIAAGLGLGVPAFKAHLIVAAAQHGAREGLTPDPGALRASLPAASRAAAPRVSRGARVVWLVREGIKLLLITLALAAVIAAVLAAWVISAER
ncbi:MAG: hypothetical protein KF859_07935 [Phycisphaeraceae bacterium]|nr:hypothetical protein [Phycisphaeraceae bacterium]